MSFRKSPVPPVNSELIRLERGGQRVWAGSEPAFVRTRIDWVPNADGVRHARRVDSLVIPLLYGPPTGPPPDPDFPPPPPWSPPPPLGVDPGDEYVPPEDPPTPPPPTAGTFREALAASYGYSADDTTAFRHAFYEGGAAGDTWAYDVSEGGLHLPLGAEDGLIDRTGMGRHGNAISCTVGERPGPYPSSDGSTYFNGVDSRIVTGWDPFATWGYPEASTDDMLAHANLWEFYLPGHAVSGASDTWEGLTDEEIDAYNANTTQNRHWLRHVRPRDWVYETNSQGGLVNAGQMADDRWPQWHSYPFVPMRGPEHHVLISGWARRQDRSAPHLLFSGTGTEDIRCFVSKDRDDVIFTFGPAPYCDSGGTEYEFDSFYCAVYPDAWPAVGEWVYWAVEIAEGVAEAQHPWSNFTQRSDDKFGVDGSFIAGAYWDSGTLMTKAQLQALEQSFITQPAAPTAAEKKFQPGAKWSHPSFSGEWRGPVAARLFINGVQAAPEYALGQSGGGGQVPKGDPTSGAALNDPYWVGLAPNPDLEPDPYPWLGTAGSNLPTRPPYRGTFVIGGLKRTDLPADVPQDWATVDTTQVGGSGLPYSMMNSDATARFREARETAGSWKGDMADVCIRAWKEYSGKMDVGVRPASLDYPRPTLVDLITQEGGPLPPIGGGEAVPDVPQWPRVGDKVTFKHADSTISRTITAIEYQEDHGMYRLFSEWAI